MSEEAPKTPKAKKPKAPAAESAAAPEVVAAAAAPAEAAAPERKEITAKELLGEELGEVKVRRAKGSKNITTGICHILATFNNTKVTITDANGNVISWGSAGRHQFRGSRKSTPTPRRSSAPRPPSSPWPTDSRTSPSASRVRAWVATAPSAPSRCSA